MTDSMVVQAQAQAQAVVNEQLAFMGRYSGAAGATITTDREQELVAGLLREVKTRYRAVEEERKKISVPMNQALKALNDFFRPAKDGLEDLERILKSKITTYLESKAQANTLALQAASVAPTPQAATEALSTVAPVAPPAGVSVRYVWRFEVTDPDLVPRHLCSPDPDKIKNVDPSTPVPGVRFFQESVVSARRG